MPSSLMYPCLLLRDKQSHHSSMFSLSSILALRGQIKLSTTTTVLIAAFLLTLYINSCEARHLRVHGNKHCPSKLPSSPPKGVIDGGGAAKGKTSSSPLGSNMDASMGDEAVAEAQKKEVAMASSGDSCRGSLGKRFKGVKVRSSLQEQSGAKPNSEQVGSNTTTAYTAETLVAMDYLDAHPAPAVHNR
ncbi:hypothetical protein HU200_007256 [Digitaria exilis]|uniref:Uncharacterized protein n=1 Tax=Digitaria exilis TaxID=1010633 RepID=A0A835FPQ1_9POAL|nr:hypothetical protein HU200_007256 [Digitaria exilis]